MRKFYAGIGSRETPDNILEQMTEIATLLEKHDWWLRSGGAGGADEAFQKGVEKKAQIWLPWANFSKDLQLQHLHHEYKTCRYNDSDALQSVHDFHPAPHRLSVGGLSLMKRNYRQIVGIDEPNSSFVICWTSGGLQKGGTAQAMKIAESLNIPIFNMYNMKKEEILHKILETDLIKTDI